MFWNEFKDHNVTLWFSACLFLILGCIDHLVE